MQLTSTAFDDGDEIPMRHTCDGDDLSPPLSWTGVPEAAQSLALIVEDPDAPDPAAPTRTWIHWVVYDLPVATPRLDEGASRALPAGAREGLNDWDRTGYAGPCPPRGRHRYFHRLFALDTVLGDVGEPTAAELERAMRGHVLASATLMGTYQRRG